MASYIIRFRNVDLKTPLKNLLKVPSKPLAVAIENEWLAMETKKRKDLKTMHLTTLAYEAIDNPFNESKEEVVDSILEYLKFDTIRFRDAENQELLKKQSRHWDPMVGWFEHKYNCHLPIDYGNITNTSAVPQLTLDTMSRYLHSHTRWPLVGVRFMTKNLKSFLLTTSLTERLLRPEQAVELARLETKHQIEKWSNVEWEHDIDEQVTNARVAAGALFYHLTI